MPDPKTTKTIIVTGDVTMDWNLAHSGGTQPSWNNESDSRLYWQRGGAALLADLIEAIARDLEQKGTGAFSVRQTSAPRIPAEVLPEDRRFHHSYSMWAPFKYGEKAEREKTAWRVEQPLGGDFTDRGGVFEWQKIVDDDPKPGIIVLDDGDLGFRDHPELWPLALEAKGKKRPWILVKMSRRLAQGALWERLYREFPDRLILVATVDDLRLSEVQISRALSWERTAQDVYWELVHNPCINSLSRCAHVVVSFGPAGAILLSRQDKNLSPGFDCQLFFDPKCIEGMWEQNYKGGMIGYTSCLTAGIVRQLMVSATEPDLHEGIRSGLAALRVLHTEGFGQRGAFACQSELAFPWSKVVEALAKPSNLFSRTPVRDPMRFIQEKTGSLERSQVEGYWTILKDRYQNSLEQVAFKVVLEGADTALLDVPWGQFGNLLTVDRQEIESYRSIRTLVSEYAGMKQPPRPLSIAVFGSPGSGKSFGVTEMAKSLLPGQIEPITFNLSQLDSVDGLISAFHQVRDIGLSGKIPLVFWDEFDSTLDGKPLGWLRYFLAPMQDGKFQEGQLSHPIGRAIFVFAGGTSSHMTEFDKGADPDFKNAKGPDFVSRLKGFINVLGPNPAKDTRTDPYFILRRAILLRSSLQRNVPGLFTRENGISVLHIDRGVLRAFLKIDHFKHGARSMEALISMSQLTGRTAFERSALPPEAQLDLHVDGKKFLSLVQQLELDGPTLELLAEAAHGVYLDGLTRRGQKPPDNESSRAFSELSEVLREANRLNVRDIPEKLAIAGYIMIPARSNEPPFNFPGEPLELLARLEHERWMQSKLEAGWAYSPTRDNAKKRHNCLVPWEKLPEVEKEKDRDLVRGIPEILARAGFTVLKTGC